MAAETRIPIQTKEELAVTLKDLHQHGIKWHSGCLLTEWAPTILPLELVVVGKELLYSLTNHITSP